MGCVLQVLPTVGDGLPMRSRETVVAPGPAQWSAVGNGAVDCCLALPPPGDDERQLGADELEISHRLGNPGPGRRVRAEDRDPLPQDPRPPGHGAVAEGNELIPDVIQPPAVMAAVTPPDPPPPPARSRRA